MALRRSALRSTNEHRLSVICCLAIVYRSYCVQRLVGDAAVIRRPLAPIAGRIAQPGHAILGSLNLGSRRTHDVVRSPPHP